MATLYTHQSVVSKKHDKIQFIVATAGIILVVSVLIFSLYDSVIVFLQEDVKPKPQVFTLIAIIFSPIWYYIAGLFDRVITAKKNKVFLKEITIKEAAIYTRVFIIMSVLSSLFFFGQYDTSFRGVSENFNSIFFIFELPFILTVLILYFFYRYKNIKNLRRPFNNTLHLNWAKDNNLTLETANGLKTNWRGNNFFFTWDKPLPEGSSGRIPPQEQSILVKIKNPFKKSFLLSPINNELWTEIGPEFLDFINKYNIEFFATKEWVVARIQFSRLRAFHIEELFACMFGIIKEMKYRREAGFEYGEY